MAKGTMGLGKYRGKMGAVVLRVVDGKQVMQEYNPNPRDANTIPQRCQREGMRLISKLGSSLLAAIKDGFSTNSYPFSAFIKANLKSDTVSGNNPDDVQIDWTSVVVAENSLHRNTMLLAGVVDFGESHHLTISMPFTLTSDIPAANLNVKLVAYCADMGQAIVSPPVTGSSAIVSCACPAIWDGLTVYVWAFAYANVGTVDPDAVNTTSSRLPVYTTESVFCGSGDLS